MSSLYLFLFFLFSLCGQLFFSSLTLPQNQPKPQSKKSHTGLQIGNMPQSLAAENVSVGSSARLILSEFAGSFYPVELLLKVFFLFLLVMEASILHRDSLTTRWKLIEVYKVHCSALVGFPEPLG